MKPVVANVYEHPELFQWTGYMEGVPEWVDPKETADEQAERAKWQESGNRFLEQAGHLLPGLGIAIALASVGEFVAAWFGRSVFGLAKSPISPILVAIALGLAIRNSIGVPSVYQAGLQLALKRILRIGVALLGIRLSLGAAGMIGLYALPVVITCIGTAIVLVTWINRSLGLPRRLGTLVAVGTAICGNTAIVATGPVIDADEDEVSYAVGCVTVFGLLALIFYPFLGHFLFNGDPQLVGYFLGTAIHDTAQVAGAGMLYVQQYGAAETLDTATVTKLVRNLFMVVVIPAMALWYHGGSPGGTRSKTSFGQMVPLFVFGFVAMALVRTLGDLGDTPFWGAMSSEYWEGAIELISEVSAWCLTIAMASVGLGTHFGRLRSLGLKPSLVGLAAALVVGAMSFAVLLGLAPWIARPG